MVRPWAPVSPASPPSPASPVLGPPLAGPPGTSRGARRSRRRWILPVALGVGVLALAAAAAVAWFVARPALVASEASPGAEPAAPAETAETEPEESSADDAASAEASGDGDAAVRCWDNSSAGSVAACPGGQSGLEGMSWVFPSFSASSCVDFKRAAAMRGDPDPAPLREEVYRCPTDLDGGPADIRYYAWKPGMRAARVSRYERKFAQGQRREIRDRGGRVRRIVWLNNEPNGVGQYELTSMYVGLPFSMSVYAATYQDLEQALEEVLRFRPPAELRGATR